MMVERLLRVNLGMPYPTPARDYLLKALAAQPTVLRALLANPTASAWDNRPDPERFSIREALAHLADWEPIWLERVQRIAEGNHPFLPSIDEEQLAIENDYSSAEPRESISRYTSGRAELVNYLEGLPVNAWDMEGDREFVGTLTLQQLATMALSHDGYHMRQVVEWLRD
jgi:uncharacterized damage-inducible protein DinB